MIKEAEAQVLATIRSDSGWELVETFARTPRWLPEGSHEGGMIIADRLTKLGLNPKAHLPRIYLGIPLKAELQLDGTTINAKATALSPSCDLSAPLTHLPAASAASRVHMGGAATLFGEAFADEAKLSAHVVGKIVVTEGFSNPARTELLSRLGAVAVIAINPGDRSHWGTNSTIWGSPSDDDKDRLPTIASVAVTRADGDVLIAAAGKEAQLRVEALHGWFAQPIVTVDIVGSDEPDQFVLLHSHYDSWEVGVGDNATGNAVLLEVARALSANRHQLRRSVRLAWWPGHSAGRYAGSTWYADTFARELRAGCIAHLNCDSPGCRDATSYAAIRGMAEAGPLVAEAIADLFGQETKLERPGRAGDYSFNNLGLSGAMLTSSMVPAEERKRRGWYSVGGCGGDPAWHTEFDTLEIADCAVLENDIKLYTLLALRLVMQPAIPLDYRLPLAEIAGQLRKDAEKAAGLLDFSTALAAAAALDKALERFGNGDHTGKANARLIAAGRHIVRTGYVSRGVFQHDPAVAQDKVPLLAALRHGDGRPDDSALTSARRGLNEVTEALEVSIAELNS